MSIIDTELIFYRSSVVSDSSTNGGTLSSNSITSGAQQNVFPNVMSAERSAGSTKYRKVFLKVANDDDLSLQDAKFWLDNITAGDDWCVFWGGTQTDTQSAITGSERKYGCGTLKTTVSAAATVITVIVEDSSLTGIFQNGDTLRITDKASPTSVTGNEEFVTIASAPSVSGDEVTITIVSPGLVNGYSSTTPTRVMSVLSAGDIECAVSGWVETSGSGTFDESLYPVICDNIGTIRQTWTLTFLDATNFTVTGDTVGSVSSGVITGDYSPNNPTFSKPYFTIELDGWAGTWANGDTVVFTTSPAAYPIWEKRVVPSGAGSLSNNVISLVVSGESA